MSILESVTTGLGNEPAAPFALASVLVIDDETMVCRALSAMLKADGHEVVTAQSGKEAVGRLRRQHFELAITDLVMPEMDGIQTMAALKELDPDIEVIVLTGHAGVESAVAALKQGACDYLLKPLNMLQLCTAVTRALEKRRLKTSLSLYEARRTRLATLDRRELIPAVLELGQGTMHATAAGLALVPPEGTGLHVDLSRSDGRFGEAAVKSLAQQAMQAREALRDLPSDAGGSEGDGTRIHAGSVLAFPLEVRNATLGALVLWRDKGEAPFTAFELRNGKILAAEIAIALDNARLYRELSRKAEELATAHSEAVRAEARARAIVDTAQEAIVLFDKEGVVWDLNPKAVEMFGTSRDEAVGHNLVDFAIPPRLLGVFKKHLETAYRVGKDPVDKCLEVIALRKNGEEFPMEVSTAVVETPQGKLLSTFARDITERKRAEAAMAERHRLATLVAEVGVALTEAESTRQGLQRCAEVLVRDIDAAFARVWTVNEKENVLELQASAGMYTHIDGGHARVPLGQFKIGRIAESGEPHLTNTVLRDSWVGDPEWARREGMVAFAGYPLKVEERVLGVVAAFARQPLTEATLQAFASVSHGIAQFIERKRAEEALRESEEKYRALIETTGTGYVIIDTEGRVIDANPEYVRLTGRGALHEVLDRRVTEWTARHDLARNAEAVRRCAELGFVHNLEIEYVNGEGKCTPIEVNATVVPVAGGVRIVSLCRDITDRKRAEEEVRAGRQQLLDIIDFLPDATFVIDRDGKVIAWNRAIEEMTGVRKEGVLGQGDYAYAVPFYGERRPLLVNLVETEDPELKARYKYVKKQGDTLYAEVYVPSVFGGRGGHLWVTASPLLDSQGSRVGGIESLRDITERKQVEQALAQERDLLRTLMDNLPDHIYFKDRQSRFLRANVALAKVFGLSDPGQAVGKTDFDFFTAEHAQQAYNDEQEVISTGKPMMAKEEKETWPDGRVTWVSTTKMPFRDTNGAIIGTFGLSHDMTKRKRAEEALRESEERYRELFENASDLVFTTDLEARRLTSLNRVAEQTIGYSREEAALTNLRQLIDPRHWHRVEHARGRLLAGDSGVTLELEIMAKDGRRVMLEVKPRLIYKEGKPIGVQGIARDITGREAAEMELRHAQKLESVGRLASGIAHEINTPIQFVGDNTRFLQDSFGGLQTLLSKYQELRDAAASGLVSPDLLAEVRRVEEESDCAYLLEEIPKALTQTLDGVTRVATIVRAMKDFAHPESKERAAADLNKALLSTLTVARNELKYVADVETDLGDLPLVVCNISDLNQVFLNLLVNAAHAIGEVVKGTGEKGKIRVRTVAEGKTVLVTITDTGCGIPEGIRSKVFDPFFTTKEVGRGTGQGLAIARSVVVEHHKGSLTFESEVGKGTTFCIRLPVESGEYSEETRVP